MQVVIIGGVATGPKVAARLSRIMPQAKTTIVEQGKQLSYGACGLPLFLGNLVPQIEDLMTTSAGIIRDVNFFADQKGVTVLDGTQALGINRAQKKVHIRDLSTGMEKDLDYDFLVLATGAKAILPPIPGVESSNVFTIHHPNDAEKLKTLIRGKKVKHVTVIGAGFIGLEIADALAGPKLKVTVCESQTHVLPKLLDLEMARIVENRMRSRGVDLRLECRVKAIESEEEESFSRITTEQGQIDTELVVIAVGIKPQVELARQAGLPIGTTGAIKVNSYMQTEDPFIFAGGDCAEQMNLLSGQPTYVPLASTANKQGRVIADNIAGRKVEFPPICATSVLQAFDLNIGRTGLSEVEAKGLGYSVITSLGSGLDSTHYYPMHAPITIKLIADSQSGRLLGAQVCGMGESVKRLDVLATALRFGARVEDIGGLDLGYAPPFATAIDVVIHAANTLENKSLGIVDSINPLDLCKRLQQGEEICFVDVREKDEMKANPLKVPHTVEIPLGELRKRYREIPYEGVVVTVCQLGIRGYDAACILKARGFKDVCFLEGGTSVWNSLGC